MNKQFKIPLQSEVERYIKEKKGWCDDFVKYYGERFYNFYMSNGWKVSGKAAMKDWKAAFNSQWQTLKFKEDIEMFNKLKPANARETSSDPNLKYVNDVMNEYQQHCTAVPKERLASIYDFLKERKLLVLNKEEVNELRQVYSGRIIEGKAAAAGIVFQRMITNGQRF